MSDSNQNNKVQPHKVVLSGTRIAPRKLRVLVDLIRGMEVEEAITQLSFAERTAAIPLRRLIESARANVKFMAEASGDAKWEAWDHGPLYVYRAYVDEGPTMRRYRPRAQGRATRIRKRTSRVYIELGTVPGPNQKQSASAKRAAVKRELREKRKAEASANA